MKCFSCGKIGHYARICPYTKDVENEDENDSRNFRNRKSRNKFHKKSLLAKECDSSDENESSVDDSDSESDDEGEPQKLMFMAMNSVKAPESITSEDESDLARQLKNHQNELGRIRMKLQENEQVIKRLQAEIITVHQLKETTQELQQPVEQPP